MALQMCTLCLLHTDAHIERLREDAINTFKHLHALVMSLQQM